MNGNNIKHDGSRARHWTLPLAAGLLALGSLSAQAQPMGGPGMQGGGFGGPGMMRAHDGGGSEHGGRMGGPGMGEHGRGMMEGGGRFGMRGLNLTEEQRDKMFTIMHAQAPEMRNAAKAVQKARDDLRALGATGQYDEAKTRAAADALGRATATMAQLHTRNQQQMLALLTPEQRRAVEARQRGGREGHEHREGREGRGGRDGRPGPGFGPGNGPGAGQGNGPRGPGFGPGPGNQPGRS